MTDTVLSVQRLVRNIGGKRILDEIYLDVPRGQCVAIVGGSGSGKSSLLRALSLIDRVDDGFIRIEDRWFGREVSPSGTVTPQPVRETNRIRTKIGMVFQDFNLWPHLTVWDNVTCAQKVVLRRAKAEIESRTDDLFKRLKIEALAEKLPSELSGGQKQRVAIARALALDPVLMLFDEPTSALDPELVGEVLSLLKDLKATGMTQIVVTHEMAFAKSVADRMLFMSAGRIIADGAPEAVFKGSDDPRIKAFFDRVLRYSS